MLPLTNGVESTKINIFVYSLLMLPVIIFPYLINFVGLIFLIPSLLSTLYYNFLCFELYNYKKNKFNSKKAKSIFGYSILYLFLVFVFFSQMYSSLSVFQHCYIKSNIYTCKNTARAYYFESDMGYFHMYLKKKLHIWTFNIARG